MGAKRITDAERSAIVDTLRETENVRETARRHGRSPDAVRLIAAAEGIEVARRSQTKAATEAKVADNRAKRELLRAELIDDARRLRKQLWQPAVEKKPMTVQQPTGVDEWGNTASGGSVVEIVEVHLDEPTFADKQRIMTAVGIAVDKDLAIEKVDKPTETEGRSILERMLGIGGD